MIGMGIPLHRIPDIRRVFQKDANGTDEIDFENDPQASPSGHLPPVFVSDQPRQGQCSLKGQ